MTEFEQYFTQIADGRINACEKMKRVSDRLMEQFLNPGEFHFDYDIANRHTTFIEKFCKLPTGNSDLRCNLNCFRKPDYKPYSDLLMIMT